MTSGEMLKYRTGGSCHEANTGAGAPKIALAKPSWRPRTMTGIHISIRLDLPNGNRIGSGEFALLEAIRTQGSITAAARYLGMAYRTAWLLVQEINSTVQQPAVSTKHGGVKRSGAVVTPVGEKVIELYHSIEGMTSASAQREFHAIARLT